MNNSNISSRVYALLIIIVGLVAFFTARMIVSSPKNDKKTNAKAQARPSQGSRSDDEGSSPFTIFNAPKAIPVRSKLSQRSMAEHDALFWQEMDTLEPTDKGVMVEIEQKGEFYVALGDVMIAAGPDGFGRMYPGQRLPLARPKLWPGGRIPHMIDSNLKVKVELKAALAELREQTGIEFISAYKEKDFVVFRAHKDQCFSHVGRIGGEQEIWLGPNCKKGEILHELMHTLGFFHEQSRPDRDEYMVVFWENLDKKYWEQYKKISSDFQNLTDSEFDFNSVMLYPPEAFALNPQLATMAKLNGDLYTVNREELSQLDIEKIRDIYKTEFDK
ncbi:MAG: hypothetical protein A2X86_13405 [Bdellovibrionales bacterium GWA2_49_15]|nr:MAG: hypothetical protein A2X86_13405 [Bdellovibrionales bacterium GWA2_49_15]HAZ13522.1 hypothetical protein [Bdellovibrionales bacterium]